MLARPELDEDHDACLKAADYIEEYGWWNGVGPMPGFRGDPACLVLAVAHVADDSTGVLKLIRGHLDKGTTKNLGTLSGWNDTHSKDEVINLLREVAYSK